MDIFDFVTQDELDELPEDPAVAFMTFVRHAQRRLDERTKQFDTRDQDQWYLIEEARYSFTNVVIAAAKRFGVEPVVSMEVPRIDKFKTDDYRQFKSDLDHFMTQLLLDNSIRAKRDSVLIDEPLMDKIRKYIHGLRTCIDQSQFADSKRAALLDILAQFEKELEKRRLSLVTVTRFTFAILAAPGALWASYDVVGKLTANILQAVGEAKAADDERRQLPPADKPAALIPPRVDAKRPKSDGRMFKRQDIDDEIPF